MISSVKNKLKVKKYFTVSDPLPKQVKHDESQALQALES